MSLLDQIKQDTIKAQKEKNELELSTLRMLNAALKNAEIAKRKGGKAELTEEDVTSVISREIKQRNDAIADYKKGGRQDLVNKEQKEIKILQKYMPAALSGEELQTIIKKAITESNAQTPADFGKVMKLIMPQVKGKADGAKISQTVKELLTPHLS